MVKVSVIIPVYNVEIFLEECLDSVVNQTLKDIEIICVNDGSTDNSLAILESFSESDDRIKIFSQENMGVAASRNRGIKLSQGEYIYFIDSEDYIELDMLEELYHNAIFNDSNIVISKIALFNDQSYEIDLSFPGFDFEKILGDVNFNNFNFDYADVKKYVLNASFAPCMKLFKREFIVENDFAFLENKAFEDILFHVRTFLNANRISFSPNCYYYYRNPKSIRNTPKSGFYIDLFKVINMVKDYLVNENYYDEFKEEFCLFKVIQILNYILMGSEDYFQMAKEELSKIKGVNNLKISEENLKRLELVLKSNSFEEYKDFLINEKNKYH